MSAVVTDYFLQAIEQALGAGAVLRGADALTRSDPYGFDAGGRYVPGGVALPDCVEQIQAVLSLAHEHRVPVWTVSTGKNLAYGGAAPLVSGSLVLDLQRMNRIIEVNEELGYAVVEPGVRFLDLYEHLQRHGHRLMMSVPDLGWGSPVGNALERGFGYAPMWDHSANICGLEFVMADGRLVRTGMGAKDGSSAWHLYKGGFGPSLEGLMQQSNFGIVTRMGLALMRQPETIITCMVKTPHVGAVGQMVETLRPLMLDGTIQSNAVIGNATVIATMMSERKLWHDGPGAMPEVAVAALAAGLGLGRWNARFGLYGTEAMAAARLACVKAAVAKLPDAELVTRQYSGSVTAKDAHPSDHSQLGIPGLGKLRMAEWRSGLGSTSAAHTDFSLVCPATANDVMRQLAIVQTEIEAGGLDYCGGITLCGRHVIALALLAFDRADPVLTAQVPLVMSRLIDQASKAGYAPYRAHLAFMDQIAAQYDFNDHALAAVFQTLKDALDPAGILSPGKQGIWPRGVNPNTAA